MSIPVNPRKVAIIGCGFVGSSSAFALMQANLFSEIVMVDVNHDKAEGEALDIAHGVPFAGVSPTKITAGTYDDIMDAAVIVMTAGAARKPGETRLDLVKKNVGIMKGIIPEISSRDYQGVVLVVANPVDILTRAVQELSGLPKERVIGTGTMLDSARLKHELGRALAVDSRSVHAYIIGEHGDSELPVFSSANVSGVPLANFCEMRGMFNHQEKLRQVADEVRTCAHEIITKKGATYYGVAMSVVRVCTAIAMDQHSVLPVSTVCEGRYGIGYTVFSLPTLVGAHGVEGTVPINLSLGEEYMLQQSAKTLNSLWDQLDINGEKE